MKKLLHILIVLSILCVAAAFLSGKSERLAADDYADRSIEMPYGSVIEQKDYSAQVDSVRSAGKEFVENIGNAAERVKSGIDGARQARDSAEQAVNAIKAGISRLAGGIQN